MKFFEPKERIFTCPYCETASTKSDGKNSLSESVDIHVPSKHGNLELRVYTCVCAAQGCREIILQAELIPYVKQNSGYGALNRKYSDRLERYFLRPSSKSTRFPDYVPQSIREDYEESASILHLSPKASATLSRRCLQGMIRDRWEVAGKNTLWQEIEAIEGHLEPEVFECLKAIKNIGNAGAHPPKSIDYIVAVEPHEAETLVRVIEDLIEEWYIQRHKKRQRAEILVSLSNNRPK